MMFWNLITCLNLDLSTPNALSTIFLVRQWARLYLSSIWVDGVLNGVMRKSFKGYPESPSSQPPSGRLAMISGMLEFDITYASCVLPGNRQLMLRNLKHEYSIVWSYRIEKCIVLHMNYICKWTALYKYVYSVWTNLISASTTPCVLRAWKFFLDT